MSMILPLGVLANQLIKIDGELRFLSIKAAELSDENGAPISKGMDARLELLFQTLESINSQLVKLQADIYPKRPVARPNSRNAAADSRQKPAPERDD